MRQDGSGRASFDDLGLSVTPSVGLSLSTGSVDFGGVDPISSPFALSPALTATVTSNTNWSLSFQGAGDLSTTTQAITTGVANTPAGTATPLDFQLQVTYTDPVSSQPFQTTLTYIATTP